MSAVLNADARPVDERVNDLNHRKARRRADAGDEVRANAHGADVSSVALFGQKNERLLVAAQRVQRFLLMQHEQVDVVAPNASICALQRLLSGLAVVAVCLRADDIVRRLFQRQTDMRISAIEIGGVQKSDAALIGVNEQLCTGLGGEIRLQWRHRERAKTKPRNLQTRASKRNGLHGYLSCSTT